MSLLDDLLAKPVAPQVAGRKASEKDFTSRVEVSGDVAEVVLRDDMGTVTEGKARDFLQSEGLDPADYEVTSFKKSQWGDKDSPKESVSFTFKKASALTSSVVDMEELYEAVRKHRPKKVTPPTGDYGFVVGLGDMQFGKGLKSDTPILTTDGWTKHGDLLPGMSVYGADGKPKRVLDVLETTTRELFEVEFGDGSVITCDADHLWSGTRMMHPTGHGEAGVPNWERRHMVIDLRTLAKLTQSSSYSSRPFVVDASLPVEMPHRELPIEPHLFGLWLGDGRTSTGAIGKGRVDADLLTQYGYEVVGDSSDSVFSVRVPGLTTALRSLGVLGLKRVPEEYLHSSVEQRLALVQGLMDTDGSADPLSGACEFSNTNENIATSMVFLLRSLGMRPSVTRAIGKLDGVEKQPYWRIRFRATMPVFTLERKLALVRESTQREGIYRSVRTVRPVGTGDAQCITVEGGLYLAGEELVVTHNCDGDGVAGTLERTLEYIDLAVLRHEQMSEFYDVGHVHIAWLGDHVEGFVSQGGANVWRTPLTLTEQIRLTRRVMLYAMQVFAPRATRITMAALPGNHGETIRFAGAGVTRYDDSHDTESLIAVADAAKLNPEAFGHVEFFVPDTDELTVLVDVAGTKIAHHHGHKWSPNKHFDWWKGQAFNRESAMHVADILLSGHLHHEHLERDGNRLFIGLPAIESESTWFRHAKGTGGCPGAMVMVTKDGHVGPIEFIR